MKLLLLLVLCSSAALAQAPAPVTDEPLSVPAIQYPAEAKQARIQGSVQLEIAVDATGKVTAVHALAGPTPLRQAAIDAYLQARYKPLIKDGRPTPALITTAVNFNLKELPPDTDLLVDRDFKPLQARCQQLSAAQDAGALAACRQAVDMGRRFTPRAELEARATAYNDLVLLLIAPGKYAGDGSARANPALPEAGILADQALGLVEGEGVHTPAVAVAHITRAEVRSLAGDLRGAEADCGTAEEILTTLLQDEKENERSGNYRVQLKETLLLHAVVLERDHKKGDAKQLRARANNI